MNGSGMFVFYDSNLGLYFSRGGYSISVEHAIENMCWVKDWYGKHICYFGRGNIITELFNLLNDKVSEESSEEYVIGMANHFRDIGLCNVWIVPIDWCADGVEVIDFGDSVPLVDLV